MLENETGTELDIQEQDTDVQKGTEEKTFTQAELDKVVADRLAREKKKYGDYYEVKEKLQSIEVENSTLKELTSVLKEANLGGTPTEQVATLREYYGLTKKQAEDVVNATNPKADDTTAFVEATKFARKANDDDVVEEVERILEIPNNKRTATDKEKIETLKDRYGMIKYKAEFSETETWYKENQEGNLSDLLNSEGFKDFAEGSTLPLKKLVEKFIKLTGKKTEPYKVGSVKDYQGSTAKEYYSPSDVDKLTPQQIADPKINAKIRESMQKWK